MFRATWRAANQLFHLKKRDTRARTPQQGGDTHRAGDPAGNGRYFRGFFVLVEVSAPSSDGRLRTPIP